VIEPFLDRTLALTELLYLVKAQAALVLKPSWRRHPGIRCLLRGRTSSLAATMRLEQEPREIAVSGFTSQPTGSSTRNRRNARDVLITNVAWHLAATFKHRSKTASFADALLRSVRPFERHAETGHHDGNITFCKRQTGKRHDAHVGRT
jgi:hypothetical protein